VTSVEFVADQQHPDGLWQVKGVDDSVLLGERLAYPTPTVADVSLQTTAYDVRTGPSESVIYDFIDANIGPSAPVERRVSNLTLGSDLARGNTVTVSARFERLGELLSPLAEVEGFNFDIVQNGNVLVFEVTQPTDRSAYVRMDIDNNRLTSTAYSYANPTTTRAIVAGTGDGVGRELVETTTPESLNAETQWGRRIETFLDGRGDGGTTELEQTGREALIKAGTTITKVSVTPTDDTTMAYGYDWNLGDTVTVVVADQEIQATVTEVGLSVSSQGVKINATVGEPTGFDFESAIGQRQNRTEARVSSLERNVGTGSTGNVPAGGTDGQLLAKASNSDYDLEWIDNTADWTSVVKQTVVNGTAATILQGQAVYVTGANGTNILVGLADADQESTSSKTLGLAAGNIAPNGHGFVVTEGLLAGLNTSAATVGDPVWLSSTAGGLIYGLANKPSAPQHLVYIGVVTRVNNNNGEIFVKPQNGFELQELHNVDLHTSAPSNKQVLMFDGTTNLWKNADVSYVHNQTASVAVWTINHPLNYNPNVTTFDTAGSEIVGVVAHPTATQVTVTFNQSTSGKAYLT
jgi:hypothetical protein